MKTNLNVFKLFAAIAIVVQMAIAQTSDTPLSKISESFSSTTTPSGWYENGFYRIASGGVSNSGSLYNYFTKNLPSGLVQTPYFTTGENPTLSFKYRVTVSGTNSQEEVADAGEVKYTIRIMIHPSTTWTAVSGATGVSNKSSADFTTVTHNLTPSTYANKTVKVEVRFDKVWEDGLYYVYLDDFAMGSGYKIDFDAGEGTVTPSSATANLSDGKLSSLPTPIREGYTHKWFTAATGGTEVTTSRVYTANTTIYAQWTLANYTITYALNGGSNSEDNPASYTIESEPITLSEPTREGYTFTDWFSNANLSTPAETTIPAGSTGNKTFYAGWEAIPYEIAYHLDEGKNHESNLSSYTIENKVTLYNPTKNGYAFSGWYYNSELSGTKVESIPLGSTGDKEFWAQWTLANYTITYALNGGANNASNPASYTMESEPITLSEPTRYGFIFTGWFSNANLSTPAETTIPTGSTGNKTFYAGWQSIQVPIIFNPVQALPSATPQYYNLRGRPLGSAKPTTPGVYIARIKTGHDSSNFQNRIEVVSE